MPHTVRVAAAAVACAVLPFIASCDAQSRTQASLPTPVRTVPDASAVQARVEGAPTTQRRTITAGGLQRSYLLTVPPGASGARRLPLIFVFHGYNEDAESIHRYSHLDRADALVVYMDGRDKAWAPAPYASTTGEQDLAFVDAVRAQLDGEFGVDRARVFAAGLSNGGGFAAYVGCQRAQDFTAIATVSAAFYERVSEGCSQIPLKHIDFHGTNDTVIGYNGGTRHQTVYDSVDTMLDEAAERNHCFPAAVTSNPSANLTERRWQQCDAALVHYRVSGGQHVWPGGGNDPTRTVTEDFATRRILEFFGVSYR